MRSYTRSGKYTRSEKFEARWKPIRDARETRAREMALLIENDRLTLEAIGKRYGVTRERVRQLLALIGYTKRGGIGRPYDQSQYIEKCPKCGEEYIRPHWSRSLAYKDLIQRTRDAGYDWGILEHARRSGHLMKGYENLSKGVAEDYAAGMPNKEIVKKYDLRHHEEVFRHLTRWGVPVRNLRGETRRPIGKDLDKQRQVVEDAKTMGYDEVAAKWGISNSRIGQLVKKFDGASKTNTGWNRYWEKHPEQRRGAR